MDSNNGNNSNNGGVRHDEGKLRMDLIPPEADLYLARVLTHGAAKYHSRNWEKGMDWSRCLGALKRHLLRWELGQMYDPESGEPHLAHVMWNAVALLVYEQRGVGKDDRPELDPSFVDEMLTVQSRELPVVEVPPMTAQQVGEWLGSYPEAPVASAADALAPSAPAPTAQSAKPREYFCSGACCAPPK